MAYRTVSIQIVCIISRMSTCFSYSLLRKPDAALCCVKCAKIICSFLTNYIYHVFSKGSLEILHPHMHTHVHTLTVAVLGAGVWPCCLPAGVPDLGVAPRCDYPGAPWLSQPGPPAPDTAPPSSGKDRRGGIRGWMRQGTQWTAEEI